MERPHRVAPTMAAPDTPLKVCWNVRESTAVQADFLYYTTCSWRPDEHGVAMQCNSSYVKLYTVRFLKGATTVNESPDVTQKLVV